MSHVLNHTCSTVPLASEKENGLAPLQCSAISQEISETAAPKFMCKDECLPSRSPSSNKGLYSLT